VHPTESDAKPGDTPTGKRKEQRDDAPPDEKIVAAVSLTGSQRFPERTKPPRRLRSMWRRS